MRFNQSDSFGLETIKLAATAITTNIELLILASSSPERINCAFSELVIKKFCDGAWVEVYGPPFKVQDEFSPVSIQISSTGFSRYLNPTYFMGRSGFDIASVHLFPCYGAPEPIPFDSLKYRVSSSQDVPIKNTDESLRSPCESVHDAFSLNCESAAPSSTQPESVASPTNVKATVKSSCTPARSNAYQSSDECNPHSSDAMDDEFDESEDEDDDEDDDFSYPSARRVTSGSRKQTPSKLADEALQLDDSGTQFSDGTRKYFVCPVVECKRVFTRSFNLRAHMVTHSETRERTHVCDECGTGFCRSQDLVRHKHIHTRTSNFVCEGCSKGFSRKDALRRHQRNGRRCPISEYNLAKKKAK